ALKYLAAVDQVLQLHWLTRERFVSLWFALFLMAALYLWGQLKFPHAEEKGTIGFGRLLSGAALLAFAVSLLPALWGSRLGELESFLPAADTEATPPAVAGQPLHPVWLKNNYSQALAQSRREHKPLLVSFSGYACTNCHWMKANILMRPEIAAALQNFVLVELYTDGTDAASSENQVLEQDRFSTVALPYYAVLDGNEKEVAHQAGLTRGPQQFLSFLNAGQSSAPDAPAQTAARSYPLRALHN
ncbi:MAG: thioredoxin family protein, partial [Acidobacteriaceae bacterium]|nr:thioredoxin family protein [Acidobacteriaceae bacterium]